MKRQSKAEEALKRELNNVNEDLFNARRDAELHRIIDEARISTLVHQRDRLESTIQRSQAARRQASESRK